MWTKATTSSTSRCNDHLLIVRLIVINFKSLLPNPIGRLKTKNGSVTGAGVILVGVEGDMILFFYSGQDLG